jgi:hypothetical protein
MRTRLPSLAMMTIKTTPAKVQEWTVTPLRTQEWGRLTLQKIQEWNGGIAGVPEQVDSEPETEENTLETEMDQKYGPRDGQDGLHPQKPRNYSHLYADLEHTAFTQYNIKRAEDLWQSGSSSGG